jgi:hypothetical protein
MITSITALDDVQINRVEEGALGDGEEFVSLQAS